MGLFSKLRKKEESKDYRYMPEPDFISINISPKDIDKIRNTLPMMPEERFKKYTEEYCLSEQDANLLISEKDYSDYFDNCLKLFFEPKTVANWIMTDLLKLLKSANFNTLEDIISEEYLYIILKLLADKKITRPVAKELFEKTIQTKNNPLEIAKTEKMLSTISSEQICKIVDQIIAEKSELKAEYKVQPDKITNFIVGGVMKQTQGKADATFIKDYVSKIMN